MAAFMVGHSPVLVLVSVCQESRHLVKSHHMLAYRTYLDLLAYALSFQNIFHHITT
jgi:hypothetical protein